MQIRCRIRIPNTGLLGRVEDPDPYWIRIQLDQWIRIRIQEGKNDPQKKKFF
jgi:hypothetical protein